MFRCDGRKELACKKGRCVLSDRAITLLLFAPSVPEDTRVAEGKNRTIVELARSMLSVNRLPKLMWAQLVNLQYMCTIILEKRQLSVNL